MDLSFNLECMPFSTYGSALAITRINQRYFGFDLDNRRSDGYYMHALYEDDRYRLLFQLSFDGEAEGMSDLYEPQLLTLRKGNDVMRICAPSENTLRFCGKCSQFMLYMSPKDIIKYNAAMYNDERRIALNVYTRKAIVYALKGSFELDAPWGDNESCQYIRIIAKPDASGEMDFVFEDFRTEFSGIMRDTSFEDDLRKKQAEFAAFLEKAPRNIQPRYQRAMETAYYQLWSAVLGPNQLLRRPGIMVSKNWMCAIWSSANMFDVLALMPTHPELAWEQYMLFVEQQDETGGMPDWISPYKINNSFVKPPIDGLMLLELMREMEIDEDKLQIIRQSLSRLVRFWTEYRDYDHDGIAEYCHGNDSMADNCTVFDEGANVESPDLSTYLALDMECLSVVCEKLGYTAEALEWRRREYELIDRMIRHNYDYERRRFCSPMSGSHEVADGDCMIDYIPILLGKRLPQEILESLIEGIAEEGRFLTPYGIASESLRSEKYSDDCYWRGSIWAPWTYFAVIGLRNSGREALAKEIAERYLNALSRSGFYECMNPRTGCGERDGALDWTANTFLILARNFFSQEEQAYE